MAVHYTVIQYVPDPVTGERVNVGIAAYSNGLVRTKFLQNWQRVKSLFGKAAPGPERLSRIFRDMDESRLIEMINSWHNSIQLTQPCTSLRSMEDALAEGCRRFLIDPPVSIIPGKLHEDVVNFAKDTLSAAITKRISTQAARAFVQLNVEVVDHLGVPRRFDLGVKNGVPLHVIQAISFVRSKSLERSVEAAAFLAQEIKDRLPFTVVAAPPPDPNLAYANARKTLEAYGARFVPEEEFGDAARAIAETLAAPVS